MEAAILLFLFASFLILLSCFVFVGWYFWIKWLRKKNAVLQSKVQHLQEQLKRKNRLNSNS